MTVKNAFEHYLKSLHPLYEKSEAESITKWVFEDRLGIERLRINSLGDETISEVKANDLAWKLLRLLKGEPVQYVLGYTFFYGIKLKVSKSVLIPRPETEELVDMLLEELGNERKDLKIMDIGTGSGCIAIAIKKSLPESAVTAIDISSEAIKLAKLNAASNEVGIEFLEKNILSFNEEADEILKYDIIISNPPYVLDSEKDFMHPNVLRFEPSIAIFVRNENPLQYYNSIASFGKKNIKPGGKIYLEINSSYFNETALLLDSYGYSSIRINKDINGHSRFITATR